MNVLFCIFTAVTAAKRAAKSVTRCNIYNKYTNKYAVATKSAAECSNAATANQSSAATNDATAAGTTAKSS